jgi:hypothetical protein
MSLRHNLKQLSRKLTQALRVMMPSLFVLAFASVAHAQGTMDFSGAQTLMGTFNTRFAYVSISRASQDARIYTNDAGHLGERLSTDVTKTSAIDLQKAPVEPTANQQSKEPPMTNSREHPQDDLRREPPTETMVSLPDIIRHEAEVDTRHYAPIEAALPKETEGYEWKRETGDIESYKHDQTGGWLHIDPQSNFYDREAQPITRENALEHAGHEPSHAVADSLNVQPSSSDQGNDQGIGL